MEKEDFFNILCSYSPEELNEFISSKGKKKMVNAITFVSINNNNKEEYVDQNKDNKKEE